MDKYKIVLFFSNNCNHCCKVESFIYSIHDDVKCDIKLINTDNNRKLALDNSIEFLPTVDVYKNDELIDRIVGLQELSRYYKKIK